MNQLQNLYRAFKITAGLVRYQHQAPKKVIEANKTYPGPDQKETPMKVFTPAKPTGHTIILFPGASPTAEEHPGMITLGRALSSAGFLTVIPRIPLLKELRITEKVMDWMLHFYSWLPSALEINPNRVSVMGLSFGGAQVLKMLLELPPQTPPPKSALVYGTYYDTKTALKFLLTGKIEINGQEKYIQPNEWGLIVLFYNYLPRVDVGYSTKNVQRILKLRVQDRLEDVEIEKQKLSGNERDLLYGILKAEETAEIDRIVALFWEECREDLELVSPKNWCGRIESKVFVMHGANDSMSPFTESVKLAQALPNSRLLISYLYEHREIATERGPLFRLKEFIRIIRFLYEFIEYSERELLQ